MQDDLNGLIYTSQQAFPTANQYICIDSQNNQQHAPAYIF